MIFHLSADFPKQCWLNRGLAFGNQKSHYSETHLARTMGNPHGSAGGSEAFRNLVVEAFQTFFNVVQVSSF